ncbi:hypothetical protein HK405_013870, partial [Cladochytrium tenue]
HDISRSNEAGRPKLSSASSSAVGDVGRPVHSTTGPSSVQADSLAPNWAKLPSITSTETVTSVASSSPRIVPQGGSPPKPARSIFDRIGLKADLAVESPATMSGFSSPGTSPVGTPSADGEEAAEETQRSLPVGPVNGVTSGQDVVMADATEVPHDATIQQGQVTALHRAASRFQLDSCRELYTTLPLVVQQFDPRGRLPLHMLCDSLRADLDDPNLNEVAVGMIDLWRESLVFMDDGLTTPYSLCICRDAVTFVPESAPPHHGGVAPGQYITAGRTVVEGFPLSRLTAEMRQRSATLRMGEGENLDTPLHGLLRDVRVTDNRLFHPTWRDPEQHDGGGSDERRSTFYECLASAGISVQVLGRVVRALCHVGDCDPNGVNSEGMTPWQVLRARRQAASRGTRLELMRAPAEPLDELPDVAWAALQREMAAAGMRVNE